ncbi:MAG TPA: 4-phosphoerythronate dehydrogenase [Nitrospirales bacterium]|jgi:erythronate-4-phosphate dehydrogenase
MKIVADANIPLAEEAFRQFGEIKLIPGRSITADHVRDADLLLVRSVTPVGAALLDGSGVRFVGSATIGVDHVDVPYLRERGIAFAYAPGSNANSVAEYVIAAILALSNRPRERRSLGIIGLGRIGKLVQIKAEALGISVLANDPPLDRAGQSGLISLDELLGTCDIVTCHVPLTAEGADPTFHLLDARRLSGLRLNAVIINTSRGPVVDNQGLLAALQKGRLAAVLDVWEEEPLPNRQLIKASAIATPHIAGYSVDGKIEGTRMLYEAASAFYKCPAKWRPATLASGDAPVPIDPTRTLEDIAETLVLHAYNIRRDDAAMKALADLSEQERALAFDGLRTRYPARWEFHHTRVRLPQNQSRLEDALKRLGFTVDID